MVGKNFFFFFFLDFPAPSSSFSSSPLVAPKLLVVPSSRSSFSKQSLNSNSNRSAFVTHDKFSGNGTKSSCSNLVFSCARFRNGLTQVNVTRENSEAVSRFDFSISVVAVISVVDDDDFPSSSFSRGGEIPGRGRPGRGSADVYRVYRPLVLSVRETKRVKALLSACICARVFIAERVVL
jgi:hypothetical protein